MCTQIRKCVFVVKKTKRFLCVCSRQECVRSGFNFVTFNTEERGKNGRKASEEVGITESDSHAVNIFISYVVASDCAAHKALHLFLPPFLTQSTVGD